MVTSFRGGVPQAAFALGLWWIGCGPVPFPELESRRMEITDGTPDDGHPSVGLLLVPGGQCTATLVGKKALLTAAHCLQVAGEHVFVLGQTQYPAREVVPHPDFDPKATKIPPDHDIGLVILEAAPSVAPSLVSPWAPSPALKILLVGFGVTADGAGDGGVKRKAENVVQDVVPTRFSVSGSGAGVGNVCKGDSGGPALATLQQQEVLVGIASAAEGACGASLSWETRADAYREWIDLAAGGDLAMVDRDAPHVVIERPAAEAVVGPDVEVEATATDDVAVVAVELLVDGTSVATLRVSPYRFPIQLQPGRHTLRAVARDAAGREGSAEVQVNVVARRHAFGEDCRTSEDCESRICLTVPGTGYCTQECAPPGEACPSTTRCVLGGNGRGLCARVPEVAEQDALDGGCAVGGASRSTPNLWTVALLGLGLVLIKRPARMAVRAPCKIPYQRVTMGDGTTLVTASAEQSLHGGSRGRGQPGAPRRGPTTDRNGPQSKGPSAPSAGPLFDRPEEPGHYHRRSCCHCESRGARSDP